MIEFPQTLRTVVSSLHPAFAMRGQPQFKASIREVIGRAARWSKLGNLPPRPSGVSIAPSLSSLDSVLQRATKFSCDVETPWGEHSKILICGVAVPGEGAFVFEWTPPYAEVMKGHLEGPTLKVGHNFAFDAAAFRANGIRPAGPIFDTMQAASLLWPPLPRSKAEQQRGKVAGGKIRMLSLAACVMRVLDGVPYWKEPEKAEANALFAESWPHVTPTERPFLYCGLDCIYTLQLEGALSRLLHQAGMLRYFEEVMMPAGVALHHVEERGMLLDVEKRDELRAYCVEEIKKYAAQVEEEAAKFWGVRRERVALALAGVTEKAAAAGTEGEGGCPKHPDYRGLTKRLKCSSCKEVYEAASPLREKVKAAKGRVSKGKVVAKKLEGGFNNKSDDHWRWLLFSEDALGFKPVSFTGKKKMPQVNDEVIETLLKKHPGNPILEARAAIQKVRTRLNTRLSVEPAGDGRVHAVISQHRTNTGRFASGNDDSEGDKMRESPANMQNQPKQDRVIYVAAPGFRLVNADWSQAEMRVMAWQAREERMIEAFERGEDVHAITAAAIYGVPLENVRTHLVYFNGKQRPVRDAGKQGGLAMNYGMGATTFAKNFGVKVEEAQKFIADYFKQWPRIRSRQKEILLEATVTRKMRGAFGRWVPILSWSEQRDGSWAPADPAACIAFSAQNAVAEMCRVVLGDMDVAGIPLITTTHDSFTAEVKSEMAMQTAEWMKRMMEREWAELGEWKGKKFRCPADVAISGEGGNWGEFSASNPQGLKGVTID